MAAVDAPWVSCKLLRAGGQSISGQQVAKAHWSMWLCSEAGEDAGGSQLALLLLPIEGATGVAVALGTHHSPSVLTNSVQFVEPFGGFPRPEGSAPVQASV